MFTYVHIKQTDYESARYCYAYDRKDAIGQNMLSYLNSNKHIKTTKREK